MGTKTKKKWYKSWEFKQICIAVIAAIASVYVLMFFLKIITRHGRQIEVPQFTGMTLNEAQKVAKAHNLRLWVVDSVYVSHMKPGMVFHQKPIPGSNVKKKRRIIITINSLIPKTVHVPNVVGLSLRQAESNLNAAQLKVGKLMYVTDIATNNILGQSVKGVAVNPGTNVPAETEIDLTIGLNPENNKTYIPNLIEFPYTQVKRELTINSLNLGRMIFDSSVKNYSDSVQAIVYKQEPAFSTKYPVVMGTKVNVYLTLDRELAAKGRTESAKRAEAEAAMKDENEGADGSDINSETPEL